MKRNKETPEVSSGVERERERGQVVITVDKEEV